MPRCQCGATTCACAVIAGDGIEVSGVGSAAQPYKVTNLRGDALARLQVIDTDSVDLTLIPVVPGDENTAYTLQADATVSMLDLTDVNGADVPNSGDVPTWNGTEWVFTPAVVAPPVSGVWGTAPLDALTYGSNSLIGREIYLDSAGKLRAKPDEITGNIATRPVTALSTAYPVGTSVMYVSNADGAAWPAATGCIVVTSKVANHAASQWCYANAAPTKAWTRYGNSTAWQPWVQVAPAAVASPVSGVFGTAPLDVYGSDSTYGQETYLDTAGKIRARPQVIPTANALAITDSPSLYPMGLSIMSITGADAPAKGWPASGTIVTFRRIQTSGAAAEQVAAQWFYQNHTPTATPPVAQYRNGNGNASPIWSSWLTVGSGSGSGSAVLEPTYAAHRQHAAATSIAHGTWTAIPFDTDRGGGTLDWDNLAANAFSISVSGWYTITGGAAFATNQTGRRDVGIYINGTPVQAESFIPNTATNYTATPIAVTAYLNAGEYVSLRVWQNSGAALALVGATANNWLSVTKVPTLSPGGGGVVVERPMVATRRHAAATSILASTVTAIPFDTNVYEDGVTWDAANSAFIAPVDGYYSVEMGLTYGLTNTTGTRVLYVQVDGVTQSAAQDEGTLGGVASAVTVKALAGQKIRVATQQTSGVALALNGNATYNYVSITKVPAAYAGSAVSTYGERNYAASRAHQAATSIATSGAITPVTFDTLSYEDGISMVGDGFPVPVAGYYDVEGQLSYGPQAGAGSGVRGAFITINGSSHTSSIATPNPGSQSTTVTAAACIKLAAGDIIRFCAYQTSGAALALSGGTAYNRISIAKVPAPVINGAAASGVWGTAPLDAATFGTDSAIGREVYIDAKGQLRATPPYIASQLVTTLAPAYPPGTSSFYIPGADSANWPSGSGVVVTHKTFNNVIFQQCSLWSAVSTKVWMRTGTSTAWAPWQQIAGDGLNKRMAAGRASVVVTASVSGSVVVNFPTGLFSAAPRVSLCTIGTSAWSPYCGGSPSSTGFACNVRLIDGGTSSATVPVDWIAIEE